MPDLTFLLRVFWEVAISGFQMGWPLLIAAFGLTGVAYFGGKDKGKTILGWVIALGGFLLFLLNLRKLTG